MLPVGLARYWVPWKSEENITPFPSFGIEIPARNFTFKFEIELCKIVRYLTQQHNYSYGIFRREQTVV